VGEAAFPPDPCIVLEDDPAYDNVSETVDRLLNHRVDIFPATIYSLPVIQTRVREKLGSRMDDPNVPRAFMLAGSMGTDTFLAHGYELLQQVLEEIRRSGLAVELQFFGPLHWELLKAQKEYQLSKIPVDEASPDEAMQHFRDAHRPLVGVPSVDALALTKDREVRRLKEKGLDLPKAPTEYFVAMEDILVSSKKAGMIKRFMKSWLPGSPLKNPDGHLVRHLKDHPSWKELSDVELRDALETSKTPDIKADAEHFRKSAPSEFELDFTEANQTWVANKLSEDGDPSFSSFPDLLCDEYANRGDDICNEVVVLFDWKSPELTPAAKHKLDEAHRAWPLDSQFRIVGHTDNTGQETSNITLSGERAKRVKAYLKELYPNLRDDSIVASGNSANSPVADNGTPDGRQRNRRAEVFRKSR
jgi:outer membrane protein OmpA-like peptidoglycan-associated protein